jgi:hypothetical protein
MALDAQQFDASVDGNRYLIPDTQFLLNWVLLNWGIITGKSLRYFRKTC